MLQVHQGQGQLRLQRSQEGTEQEVGSTTCFQAITLTTCRDLAESLDRVDMLQDENLKLRNVMFDITQRPGFRPEENTDLLDVLAKVW
jgi:hypothetical protein